MYSTFRNVVHNTNLSIRCLFKTLQAVRDSEGCILDVLYYQIDGGSENTADHVFAGCVLLISKQLTKKVVVSLMPVENAHDNIDSKFAFTSLIVRNNYASGSGVDVFSCEGRAGVHRRVNCVHNEWENPRQS